MREQSPSDIPHPGLRRILAPNPSPMTEAGTNTYLVGQGDVALVDPGPDLDQHLAAIEASLAPGERITDIFVTHSHVDHSALTNRLAERTGACVHAFGDSAAGRSPHLADLDGIGGGEGVDHHFEPHRTLSHDEVVTGKSWSIHAHWTPGHFGNHMVFEWEGVAFSGDMVMGWAPSLVSPPDGDLTAFMASLDYLRGRPARRYFPGHGAPVDDPVARVDELYNHRKMREAQILSSLNAGPADAAGLTALIYVDVPLALHGAARRNVLAHLIDLVGRGAVTHAGLLGETTVFALP